jgi:uncharacterized coiled-coil DUF342 family protein
MTDDIVKRLREWQLPETYSAADEIERLRAELAAERERVKEAARAAKQNVDMVTEWVQRAKAYREERDKLREALERIAAIEDKAFGGDWDEIEEARTIARAVLKKTGGGDE